MQIPTLADLGVVRSEKILSNGVRLVHFDKPSAPVTLKIVFDSGSRFDPPGKEGIAHFVEHLIFAGTKGFPQKDELAMYIETKGGMVGASTNHEVLCVDSGISEPRDIDILTEFLGELLSESLFTPQIIESERGSIMQEIGSAFSNAEKRSRRGYGSLIYQGTAYEHPVLGSKETLASITRDDVLGFYYKYIVPERCSIVSAGGISIEEMSESIERNLHFANKGEPYIFSEDPLPVIREKFSQIFYDENVNHLNFLFGFRTASVADHDAIVLVLIASIVGGGRASILNRKLRYEKGLTYSICAHRSIGFNIGDFTIDGSTAAGNIANVFSIICGVIRDLKKDGIPADLIANRKEYMAKRIRVRFETAESWVENHFMEEMIPSYTGITAMDRMKKLQAVTNEDIIRVANKYFKDDAWYMTVAGNIKEADLPKITL